MMESEEIDIDTELRKSLNSVCITTSIVACALVAVLAIAAHVGISSHRVEIERLRLAQMQYQQKEEVTK